MLPGSIFLHAYTNKMHVASCITVVDPENHAQEGKIGNEKEKIL